MKMTPEQEKELRAYCMEALTAIMAKPEFMGIVLLALAEKAWTFGVNQK